ncbi:OmpA family protein [Pseudotabrizicola formosa]|uniref:OmpA family protein n=1 Tax=Pseudotabrizicola formosa TaxID=2030009 RepID=UPI001FEEA9AE|nr:OmpA family protein [Pseudotabrizicola formosa]
MKQTGKSFVAAFALALVPPIGLAQAVTLEMPFPAVPSVDKTEALSSYALPLGAYADGEVPIRTVEGPLRQTAWRIDAAGATTLEVLAPLRAQLTTAGFTPVFECDSAACGGFDFRYATQILPEPEMHVDLGDYRFYAAERGEEVVSLIVSRTAAAGFVQMIHVGGPVSAAPLLTTSTKTPEDTALPAKVATGVDPTPFGERLISGGAVALEDLEFASGASTLSEGPFASLTMLADWLRQNPAVTVALVGHTDASGGLEGNIALSRQRAEAVRQVLISAEGIPAARVAAQGVGYLAPRSTNLTEDGRDKNRRVEVIVTSTPIPPAQDSQ